MPKPPAVPEPGTEPIDGLTLYQSVKKVRAGEITEVVEAGCYVRNVDGGSTLRRFPPNMTARYKPRGGDFWVIYDGDNYQSISPRDQFINGYIEL